jgi:hypothetical protein
MGMVVCPTMYVVSDGDWKVFDDIAVYRAVLAAYK